MLGIAQALGVALVLGGIFLWASTVMPPLPPLGVHIDEPLIAAPLPASDDGPVTLTGMIVYEEAGEGAVPYIAYELPHGGMRIKQLVFGDRGCSPAAGDLPCAPSTQRARDFPERALIRVTGRVYGDQIVVERIEGIY